MKGNETILNQEDVQCGQCLRELPKGEYIVVDSRDPLVFCDDECWARFYKIEDDTDPYKEIERENVGAIESRRRDDDDF